MSSKSKGLCEPSSAFRGVRCFVCKRIERDSEDYDHWTFFISFDGYYRFRCAECSEQLSERMEDYMNLKSDVLGIIAPHRARCNGS